MSGAVSTVGSGLPASMVSESLPIASIIQRIQEEDDDESLLSDYRHPTSNYTGGKWKPPTCSQSDRFEVISFSNGPDSSDVQTADLPKQPSHDKLSGAACDLPSSFRYRCEVCSFGTNTHDELLTHTASPPHSAQVEKLVGPFSCVGCNFATFERVDLMQIHLGSSDHPRGSLDLPVVLREKRGKIVCPNCSKVQHSTSHYSKHIKSCKTDKFTKCWYCDYQSTRTNVHKHVSREHRDERPFLCSVCDTDFHSVYELGNHRNTDKHVLTTLENHQQTLQSDEGLHQSSLHCQECRFECRDIRELQSHYIKRHEEDLSGFTVLNCRFCRCPYLDGTQLFLHEVYHIQLVSSSPENLTCLFCEKVLPTPESLTQHLTKHNIYGRKKKTSVLKTATKAAEASPSSTRHTCTYSGCTRIYSQKSDLNRHLLSHTGEKSFACFICTKQFLTKKQLKAHELTHQTVKAFSCDYCEYKSRTKCHLDRHMRIHAGSKPYTCPYCSYSSTTIGNLRKHVLRSKKHKGLPMYICEQPECNIVSDSLAKFNEHLWANHKQRSMSTVKSTEMDWLDIAEGHPIIHVKQKQGSC